ncbi:cation diffusion facilitator family transporter [Sphingomonas astaxanthinifaciens]|uniref:Cobalt transporter n=1 Tax=Sphingomonas astaxanthinifaciens DSM 22298 TaxID=1123267 RepID=A0ABQ5Z4B6_9SPHN|nr:cation diffusion facilitator family transporter [Sphingomonas astaxanthinifaciens]GLR47638.1 cobalt transporter [Sphingomonas astaxanthinifaciens DSM 22298]
MASDHSDHGHSHAPADFGRAFAIGIALNVTFVAIEAGYGVITGSLALLADAGHNLSDVLGLLVAWAATALSRRPPTARFTYGLKGSSILAALANAVLLLVAIGAIIYEAIGRFSNPQPVGGVGIMVVAAIGIVINAATAWLFASGRKGDLNIRGAYLHMAADAAVSAAVVVAGALIWWTGREWIDPLVSIMIAFVVLWSTWALLRDSVVMSLSAVPSSVELVEVESSLARRDGVTGVHDLHVWSLGTTSLALTAHLVMPGGHPGDEFLTDLAEAMEHDFGIAHSTFQIEISEHVPCALQSRESG